MARISGYSPTPEVENALAQVLKVNNVPGKPYDSAAGHPLLNRRPAPGPSYPRPFDMQAVARHFSEQRYSRWSRAFKANYRAEMLAALTARNFSSDEFVTYTPDRDLIETCYPTHVRDFDRASNPYDPAEIKPTWCSFPSIVASSDYDPSPSGQRPGWTAGIDGDGWFRDTEFRQRALYYDLSSLFQPDSFRPLLVHLTGTIQADSSRFGAVTWFAPAIGASFGEDAAPFEPAIKPMPYAYRTLVQRDLAVPVESSPWSHSVSFDWLINLTALRKRPFSRRRPIVRLNVSAMATFGRYHATCLWANCSADLQVTFVTNSW